MATILAHALDGNGPPLILLNGGMMSIGAWQQIAEALAARFGVVRCDFRGQLLSPFEDQDADPASYSLADHAADVVALLDHLEIPRAHVAGTSFGAEVAMLLAADHPGRVKSLAVLTATDALTERMRAEGKALEALALRAAAGGDGAAVFRAIAPNTFGEAWLRAQPPDFVEARARQFGMLPAAFHAGVASLMRSLATLDLASRLPTIGAPALVVAAGLDRTFPLEHSRAIASAIPGARLEVLEECGHAAVVEAPSRIAGLLLEFVSSVEGG